MYMYIIKNQNFILLEIFGDLLKLCTDSFLNISKNIKISNHEN